MTELAGAYNIFFGLVKAGNLSNLVEYYDMCDKFYGTNTDLTNLFIPRLNEDASISYIISTPYGHALTNGNLPIVKWLYSKFPNVKYNMENVIEYNLFSVACTYTNVDVVHWLITTCDFLTSPEYHTNAFMSAVSNHKFAIADYLCIVYTKQVVYDLCMKHVFRNLLKKPDMEILEYVSKTFIDYVI